MKKFLLILSLVLTAALGAAAEVLTISTDNWVGKWTEVDKNYKGTFDDFTVLWDRGTNTSTIRLPDAADMRVYANSSLVITAPKGAKMTKVVFTVASGGSLNSTTQVKLSDGWSISGTPSTALNTTFNVTSAGLESFTFSVTKQFRTKKIEITYTPAKDEKKDFEYTGAKAFDLEVGDMLDLNDALGMGEGTPTFSYSITDGNEFVEQVDEIFEGVAEGTATVNVSWDEDDTYTAGEFEITINVKAVDHREEAILLWDVEGSALTANMWETKTIKPEYMSDPEDLDVTFASSDETVASIAEDGNITLKKAGTTVITVSFAGNDEYKDAEDTFTLTVDDILKPVFKTAASIKEGDKVEIEFDSRAKNTYTIDGGEAIEYTGPFELPVGKHVVIAYSSLGLSSIPTQRTFTVAENVGPTFDFTTENYGITETKDNNTYDRESTTIIGDKGVIISLISNDNNNDKWRIWIGSNNVKDLRIYGNTDFKIIAPKGKCISEIIFNGATTDKFNLIEGQAGTLTSTTKTSSWTTTENYPHTVSFKLTAGIKLNDITVKMVDTNIGHQFTIWDNVFTFGQPVVLYGYKATEIPVQFETHNGAALHFDHNIVAADSPAAVRAYAEQEYNWTEAPDAKVTIPAGNGTLYVTTKDAEGNPVNIRPIEIRTYTQTGVDSVAADAPSAEIEIYTLAGIRVYGEPAPGIYLRRQGTKITKIIID